MSSEAGSTSSNSERQFIYVVIIASLLFGAGFALLMLKIHSREKPADGVGADGLPRLIAPDRSRQLADFSLTDRTGRSVTQADLAGKILVVDFLFTSCSLTCPVVNRCMSQIQDLVTNRPEVRLVSLTVDPRDDTVPVLDKYGEHYGADPNRWLLLTGEQTTLYNLIGTSFLAKEPDDPFNYMPGNFSHTDRIAVVDAQGSLRGFFDGLNTNTAAAVFKEIDELEK